MVPMVLHTVEEFAMELLRLFSTPIGVVNFGEMSRKMNKRLITVIDTEIDEMNNSEQRSWADNSASTVKNLLQHTCFQQLNKVVTVSFQNIMAEYGYKKEMLDEYIGINYYWGNRATRGGWSRPHYHGTGDTLWSGVYYPQGYEAEDENLDEFDLNDWMFTGGRLPKDAGGFLCLQDNAFMSKGLITPGDRKVLEMPKEFILRHWVKPRQGLLILFPAWQEHFVEPISKDETRYSISFAIQFKESYYGR